MELINPTVYGESFAKLIDPDKLNVLGPGNAEMKYLAQLESMDLSQSFTPKDVKDRDYAKACLAGIWLHHDFLDQSHTLSQSILNTTGSYWHGIMHRREGDYWNSKYWFRRVGEHPIFNTLNKGVVFLCSETNIDQISHFTTQSTWDPFHFVDLVEEVINSGSELEKLCQKIQLLEWQLLFDYSFTTACH